MKVREGKGKGRSWKQVGYLETGSRNKTRYYPLERIKMIFETIGIH